MPGCFLIPQRGNEQELNQTERIELLRLRKEMEELKRTLQQAKLQLASQPIGVPPFTISGAPPTASTMPKTPHKTRQIFDAMPTISRKPNITHQESDNTEDSDRDYRRKRYNRRTVKVEIHPINQQMEPSNGTYLKMQKQEMFDRQGEFRKPDVFIRSSVSLKDYLEEGKLHIDDPRLVKYAMSYTKGPANKFVLNWRTWNLQGTVPELLHDLQQEFVPKAGKEKLYNKFKAIRQEAGGRLKPIIEEMEQLRKLQMLLPHVTDRELYYTFKDAIEPELFARVETKIDEETSWEDIKTIAQIHDKAFYKIRERKGNNRTQQPQTS